jgi:STAG domain-containing protein
MIAWLNTFSTSKVQFFRVTAVLALTTIMNSLVKVCPTWSYVPPPTVDVTALI